MDIYMKELKSSDVDQLCGLTLNIAYAIFIEGWKWYHFPGTETPNILLDAFFPKNKIPDKDCAMYIGGDNYVFKDIPRYNESLTTMLNHGTKLIDAGYGWKYSYYIEKEIGNSDHINLLHCNSDKRCRAILKFYLDNPCPLNDVVRFSR